MPVERRRTLAVTVIDKWLRWKGLEHGEAGSTFAEFRKDLLERTQGEPAIVGTAGHKVLEEFSAGVLTDVLLEERVGMFSFGELFEYDELLEEEPDLDLLPAGASVIVLVERNDKSTVTVALRWELPGDELVTVAPIREAKVEREYSTTVGPVLVKGKVDGFDGTEITDYKFTGRPDVEALERGFQWRTYLDITGADAFRWEVFTMRPPLRNEQAWRITERQTCKQYRYPGMRGDVAKAVDQCAQFIELYVPEYWDRYELLAAAAAGEGE